MNNWDDEIEELRNFFNSHTLPKAPLSLHPWTTIVDMRLYIRSHLETVKANSGKETYLPYLMRLQELKKYIEEHETIKSVRDGK